MTVLSVVSVNGIGPMAPIRTYHSTIKLESDGLDSAMPAGTSKVSTRSTRKRPRSKVYPVAGFVTFNWQRSAIGNEIHGVSQDKIELTARDKDKLELAQLICNRRGFVMALICPKCGSVVQTSRGSDLPDGCAAKCPMPDCTKEWWNEDN